MQPEGPLSQTESNIVRINVHSLSKQANQWSIHAHGLMVKKNYQIKVHSYILVLYLFCVSSMSVESVILH